jgi:hypothetical protein
MQRLSLLAAALLLLPPGEARALVPEAPAAPAVLAAAAPLASGLPGSASPLNGLDGAHPQLLARGGGGRGGGGGGGGGGRGGGGRGGSGGGRAQRANTGMDRPPRSLDRGNRQPSGGWSRDLSHRSDRARPSLDRSDMQRPAAGNRQQTRDRAASFDRQALQDRNGLGNRDALRDRSASQRRDDWDRASERLQNTRNERRDTLNNARDNWKDNRSQLNDRIDRAADRYNNYWPGWARPGWNVARPWNWGWYGSWASPPWGWWAARSVAWGVTSLATAAVINNAVNDAIAANQTLIVVPQSSYELYYNSIAPSGDQQITFVAVPNGGEAQTWTADCRSGSLNGYQPSGSAEAQLLNAACQVAFGS